MARSTKYCLAMFGLSESIVSMSFRAQSKVAANRMACLRSSVILGSLIEVQRRGLQFTVWAEGELKSIHESDADWFADEESAIDQFGDEGMCPVCGCCSLVKA